MKYNIYYIRDSDSFTFDNVTLANTLVLVESLLRTGAEITGIIDVEKD